MKKFLSLILMASSMALALNPMPPWMNPGRSLGGGNIVYDSIFAPKGEFDTLTVNDQLNLPFITGNQLYMSWDGTTVGLDCPTNNLVYKRVGYGSGTYIDATSDGSRVLTLTNAGVATYTDDDGATIENSGTGLGVRRVRYSNGLWINSGSTGVLWTSPTGDFGTWTSRTSGTGANLNGSAWSGSKYIVTGAGGVLRASTNGVTWSGLTLGVATDARDIACASNVCVVVGNSGMIRTSDSTGGTWTSRTSGVATTLWYVIWDGAQFVTVGASGVILTSPTGETWTSRTSGVAGALYSIAYNGTTYAAVGDTGIVITSANSTAWTRRNSGTTTTNINSVTSAGADFFAVGDAAYLRRSTNEGVTWNNIGSNIFGCLYRDSVVTSYLTSADAKTINGTVGFAGTVTGVASEWSGLLTGYAGAKFGSGFTPGMEATVAVGGILDLYGLTPAIRWYNAAGDSLKFGIGTTAWAVGDNLTDMAIYATAGLSIKMYAGGTLGMTMNASQNVTFTANVSAATYSVGATAGADGSFTTVDLKTVTVTKGIITVISP